MARGELVDLRPVSDTFVLNPGSNPPHNGMIGAQDCDFGGAGTRAVAAAAAHVSTAAAPNNQPHGYFRSLLRFDAAPTQGEQITSAVLQLFTTRDMNGGLSMFNPKAQSGYFKVSLMQLASGNEWTQGLGAPETMSTTHITNQMLGTTDNILNNTVLPLASIVDLKTFYFDASLLGTDPNVNQTWLSYDVNCPALQNALSAGGTFTLLLSAADKDNTVSFTFQCRVQRSALQLDPVLFSNGPHLLVTAVPEPGSAVVLISAAIGIVMFRVRQCRTRDGKEVSQLMTGGC